MKLRPIWLACALLAPVTPPAQQTATAAATLTVAGDVTTPLTLSAADLAAMPRARAELRDGAKTTVYEGVLVGTILAKAGVPMGAALHGADLTRAILASASDGYQAVFSIGELDQALSRSEVLVADTVDGGPLPAAQGGFRLVVPKDTRGARGVRMLQRLDVIRVQR